jgi:hypothetical protein
VRDVRMAGLGVFFWLSFLNVYKYAQRKPHTGPLAELEHRRAFLAAELSRLGDLRPGSSTSIVAVAASPTVIALSPTILAMRQPCASLQGSRQDHQGSLTTPASVRKAERETAEFRKFQEPEQLVPRCGRRAA